MVSASSPLRKSMPRISAPICLDNGTTSTLAAIATFMFILDGTWQLQRAYLRKMLHCGSLPINYLAKIDCRHLLAKAIPFGAMSVVCITANLTGNVSVGSIATELVCGNRGATSVMGLKADMISDAMLGNGCSLGSSPF